MEGISLALVLLMVLIVVAPIRLAYIALLTLAFFDVSGPDFASASNVGVLNAAKIVIAPLFLLIRLRFRPLVFVYRWRKTLVTLWLFLALTLYAAIASLWTPEFLMLSALKQIGYFLGYLLWFTTLLFGVSLGIITKTTINIVAMVGVLLAFLQTYVLNGPFSLPGQEQVPRFTAFSSPQSYAAFYSYLAILILFLDPKIKSLALVGLFLLMILLSGSRYTFITSFLSVLVWSFYLTYESRTLNQVYKRIITVSLALLLFLAVSWGFLAFSEGNRIKEITELDSPADIGTVGTFLWRMGMWEVAIEHMQMSTFAEIFFGHGTSSSALVALSYDLRYEQETIDANRVMHNEFLRSIYEWGIIGFGLLITIWLAWLITGLRLAIQRQTAGFLILALLVPVTGGLFLENILAGAGSPVGIGLALSPSWIWFLIRKGPYAHLNAPHPLPAARR